MKSFFLLIVPIILTSLQGYSQSINYKPFEVDAGILIAFPVSDDLKFGAGGYLEPKYNIHDNVALGFKMELAAITSKALMEINGDLVEINISGITSFMITGDYYFTNDLIRPLAGIATGIYLLGDINYQNDIVSGEKIGTRFGIAPRVGVVAGHFRISAEYNYIPGLSGLKSRDYLGLKLGFEIGGGKINGS